MTTRPREENSTQQPAGYPKLHRDVLSAIRSLLLGMSSMVSMIRCPCDEE